MNKVQGSPHYREGGIEVLDVLKAKMSRVQYEGFLLGNVIKYSLRCNFTGREIEDIKKCRHYCDLLLEQWTQMEIDR